MALRVIASRTQAVNLDKKNKVVSGFLISARTRLGKFKNAVYKLQTTKGTIEVWGNAAINGALLDKKEADILEAFKNKWVELKWLGERKSGTGKKVRTFNDTQVSVDDAKKMPKSQVPF